jgi:3D (Asp-Asp-Asp) domain-containing protein
LDVSEHGDGASLPAQTRLRLTRVSETLELDLEPLAFESMYQDSAEIDLGLENVLEPGRAGVAVTRTRVQYRDGVETSRETEPKAVVLPPQDAVILRGSRIAENSAIVDGVTLQYWRVLQMYATVYSPCNSGTPDGSCSSGTASGLPLGKGVVAMDPGLYAYLNGQRLYIPGYGYATVADVGGGFVIENNLGISRYKWIDLGFDDDNIQDLTGWITVYFLSPAPATIPDALR